MPTVTLRGFQCLRCNHQWFPRKKGMARVCPKCKSPYWDTPRRKTTQKAQRHNKA